MLTLSILGSAELRARDEQCDAPVVLQPKRFGLLVHLALHGRLCRRDLLLPLFWPDTDQAHARHALRQAVHALRQALGPDAVVSRGEEEIGIAAEQLRCDVTDFRLALAAGRPAEALALYRGDLAPGLFVNGAPEFDQWLEAERAQLRRAAAEAAGSLAAAAMEAGDGEQAVRWARREVELAWDDEVALRRLMTLLDANGLRSGAVAAYEEFRSRARLTYGLEPSNATRILAEQLRSREQGAEAPLAPVARPTPEPVQPRARAPRRVPLRAHLLRPVTAIGLVAVLAGFVATHDGRIVVLDTFGRLAPGYTAAPSVAVLPLLALSTEQHARYLGDAIAVEVIHALAGFPELRVAPRTSSFAFRDARLELREIARRLEVDHVLEGSVRTHDGRLRLMVRLVDTTSGRRCWERLYEREIVDPLATQAELGAEIARALREPLVTGAVQRVSVRN